MHDIYLLTYFTVSVKSRFVGWRKMPMASHLSSRFSNWTLFSLPGVHYSRTCLPLQYIPYNLSLILTVLVLTLCLPYPALFWGQPTWLGLRFSGLVHEETNPCVSNFIQSIFETVQAWCINSVRLSVKIKIFLCNILIIIILELYNYYCNRQY